MGVDAEGSNTNDAADAASKSSSRSRLNLTQISALLTSVATIAALGFTAISLKQNQDQQAATEQGQITDRFNAAIANLGANSLDERLGGLFALQRIMQDSPRDQPAVVDIMVAYIRDHAAPEPTLGPEYPLPDGPGAEPPPPTDIQAALTIIGARDPKYDGSASLNLSYLNLIGVDIRGSNFAHADLEGVYLFGARIDKADFSGANLETANLTGASAQHADFTSADLFAAEIDEVDFTGADLQSARFECTSFIKAEFAGANLKNVDLNGGSRQYSTHCQ